MRAEDLGVHAAKMEIDVVLLLLFRSLYDEGVVSIYAVIESPRRQVLLGDGHTGASMHILICCSNAMHPCAACPEDAQHPSIAISHDPVTACRNRTYPRLQS